MKIPFDAIQKPKIEYSKSADSTEKMYASKILKYARMLRNDRKRCMKIQQFIRTVPI